MYELIAAGPIEGRCLCRAVEIRVDGRFEARPGACHCRMCQIWTGGLFLAFTAEAAAVTVMGEVTRFRSSAFAERAFCPRCGSHLWMRNDGGDYDLMPGLFAEAADWPLRSEIYSDRAMACIRLAGEHDSTTQADWEAENPFVEEDPK